MMPPPPMALLRQPVLDHSNLLPGSRTLHLVGAAVLLIVALRLMKQALAPIGALVQAIAAAAGVVLVIVAALVLLVVAAFGND
jgi:hypothetical protein